MSDWGATHSTSIEAGLDVEMPSADFMGAKLLAAVQAQQIDEAYVDDAGIVPCPFACFDIAHLFHFLQSLAFFYPCSKWASSITPTSTAAPAT